MHEAALIAQNLARNCGYAVFPVGANKHPTRPKSEGGDGFKDASRDPERIAWLWDRWPGPLIGIATGKASGISVLDIDQKHHDAWEWWQANHGRLLPTRAFETRSGGVHLYYQHRDGIGCSRGGLPVGVDVRGDGGYIIYWFAAGLACRDQTPPVAWPEWLLEAMRPPPPPPVTYSRPASRDAIAGIVRHMAGTPEGNRNDMLFWCARKLLEHGIAEDKARALLLPAAAAAGLASAKEQAASRNTIASAFRGRAA